MTDEIRGARERVLADKGCEHSPSCFKCPLALCVHDVPLSVQLRHFRDVEVISMFNLGSTVQEVGERFKLEPRTIVRIIQNPTPLEPRKEMI